MESQTQQKFGGWVILASCFIIMFFVQGGLQTFAVFLPAIMQDTGFTLGEVAMISTVATVAAFFANMSIGTLLKMMSAKAILFIGAFICAGHFIIYSMANSLTMLYIGAFCGGLSIGLGTVAPVSVVMTNWFIKKRATYMSIVIAGSMFGGAVLMPMSGVLIDNFNWRTAYRLLSLAVAVVTFFVILVLVVDDPKKKNQRAYGEEEATTDKSGQPAPPKEVGGVTLAQARSSISFWLLLAGILLVGCSTNIENFLPAFWRSQGMSVKASASIMGLYALFTGVCTIIMGGITDKLGGKVYITMTAIFFIIGCSLIYFVGAGATYVVILAVIPFAAGAKKTSTLTPPLVVAEAFGRKNYGAIIGYFTGMLQLGIALSNPIIGRLHSTSGGYKLPFTVMACLSAVAMFLVIFALVTAPYKKSAPTTT